MCGSWFIRRTAFTDASFIAFCCIALVVQLPHHFRMKTLLFIALVPTALLAQSSSLSGTWVGSGALTNNWTDADNPESTLSCAYNGGVQPPSVVLRIPPGDGLGELILAIPSSSETCPPLRKRFSIRAQISATRVTFTDPAGDRWSLILTNDLLTGQVAWTPSDDNPSESLATGFTYREPLKAWDVPRTRLFGKVTLRRARIPAR